MQQHHIPTIQTTKEHYHFSLFKLLGIGPTWVQFTKEFLTKKNPKTSNLLVKKQIKKTPNYKSYPCCNPHNNSTYKLTTCEIESQALKLESTFFKSKSYAFQLGRMHASHQLQKQTTNLKNLKTNKLQKTFKPRWKSKRWYKRLNFRKMSLLHYNFTCYPKVEISQTCSHCLTSLPIFYFKKIQTI
jgi:hypothetical protein